MSNSALGADKLLSALTHRVAGITIRTESEFVIPHLRAAPFEHFRVDDGQPDISCHIWRLDTGLPPMPPLTTHEREQLVRCIGFPPQWLQKAILRAPQVRARLAGCLAQPEWVHVEARWNRAIIYDYAHHRLDLFYPPERQADFAAPIVIAGYRGMITRFLPGFSALAIHAAGVVRQGVAALFLAVDGGGKSTLVRTRNEPCILNDDHVILRCDDGLVTAHATPLGPLTSGPRWARLGGIFVLEKAPGFGLEPASTIEVLEFLWQDNSLMGFRVPESLRVMAFDILNTACHQARTYRLRFSPQEVDWDAIDRALSA